MITWYSFEPTDSLFFKGATPMQAGVDHTADSIFPPRPSTLEGALRTLVLRQHDIGPADYYQGNVDKDILDAIGRADEPAPFSVIGPLFRINGRLLIPTPYTWYKANIPDNKKPFKVKIVTSFSLADAGTGKIVIITSAHEKTRWVYSEKSDIDSMGGLWMTTDLLCPGADNIVDMYSLNAKWDDKKPLLFSPKDLFTDESHVGLALKETVRTARPHHLYAFTHYRLKPGVSLVFGCDRELPLREKGIFQLGGEKRFGAYKRLCDLNIQAGSSGLFMALGVVKAGMYTTPALIATGKPVYAGGWDMRKGFHKEMSGYYPAGTVFNARIEPNLIEI
ncbi:MAG: type III-B CRISPR module-associated Cmr3 family protein [Desulfomonilia bacterium]